MKEVFVSEKSLPAAYHKALFFLEKEGDIINCSDYNQKQKELAMTVHIQNPLWEPMISKCIIGGPYDLQRYIMELIDGVLDCRVGSGWDYTYHQRFNQWMPKVVQELKRNKETRRAVISIRDNEKDFQGTDPACFQNLQYFIRDNKLDCCVLFRSNDLPEAFFFNAFGLIMLQKKIADELGVEVGTYTHRSNSMHCYEKDFKMLESFSDRIRLSVNMTDNLTYGYIGDWENLMKEEIPNVLRTVEQLKL